MRICPHAMWSDEKLGKKMHEQNLSAEALGIINQWIRAFESIVIGVLTFNGHSDISLKDETGEGFRTCLDIKYLLLIMIRENGRENKLVNCWSGLTKGRGD